MSAESQPKHELIVALRQVAEGREDALQTVVDRTSAKLFGICLRILKDRSEAEDALQDVYVSVWKRAGGFDPDRASPITWLATIARNRAIDRQRSAWRSRSSAPVEEAADLPDMSPGAEQLIEAGQDRVRLMACVDELKDHQSDAVRTAFFDGLSYSQLAERVGVPLGTMKSWIRRAMAQLRDCLER